MKTRYIESDVFDFVMSADKEQLEQMKTELTKEINQGILTAPKYQKELDLINSRLV
jgi:hypothetical protein